MLVAVIAGSFGLNVWLRRLLFEVHGTLRIQLFRLSSVIVVLVAGVAVAAMVFNYDLRHSNVPAANLHWSHSCLVRGSLVAIFVGVFWPWLFWTY